MRWKAILFATLPLANALSLANFQDITSVLIPLTCQITYASTIPSCTKDDFQEAGCSPDCAQALTEVAKSVTEACSNVIVTSNTLLGIIKNGGILQALCPTIQSSPSSSATTIPQSSKSPSLTRSIPSTQTSPSAIITSSRRKSSTTSSSQVISSTTESTSAEEPTETFSEIPTLTQPTDNPTPTQDEASTSETSSVPASKSKQSDGRSGGGSPFDISSSAEKRFEKGSMLAFVIAAWAGIILWR